jgi:hypothetical protein
MLSIIDAASWLRSMVSSAGRQPSVIIRWFSITRQPFHQRAAQSSSDVVIETLRLRHPDMVGAQELFELGVALNDVKRAFPTLDPIALTQLQELVKRQKAEVIESIFKR